jgi:hypothetical protein
MTLSFGVFDHLEPVPGLRLDQIHREPLLRAPGQLQEIV